MIYKTSCLLLLFTIALSLQAQTNPNPSAVIDNVIMNKMNASNIAGLSAVIVKDGEIVWLESYGLADVANNIPVQNATVFSLASVSKIFTATAIMQLLEKNAISSLHDPINDYLPISIAIPGHTATPITFHHLLTHTSSIKDNGNAMSNYYSNGDPAISLASCIQRYFDTSGSDYSVSKNFHSRAPGIGYDYSNMAMALLGYLVEVISGMPFDAYCDINIFNPLCMDETSWFLASLNLNNVAKPHRYSGGSFIPIPHYGFADYPNGQLRSNAVNLANFMIAFLQGGGINNNNILTQSTVNMMLSRQIPSISSDQGLGWYEETIFPDNGPNKVSWGHNGGEDGVTSDLYINLNDNIGIAVIANTETDLLPIVDELYTYALTINANGVGNPSCGNNCDGMSVSDCSYSDCSLTEFSVTDEIINEVTLNSYKSQQRIMCSATLKEITTYEFIAGQEVILQPSFEVKNGVTFLADIGQCDN